MAQQNQSKHDQNLKSGPAQGQAEQSQRNTQQQTGPWESEKDPEGRQSTGLGKVVRRGMVAPWAIAMSSPRAAGVKALSQARSRSAIKATGRRATHVKAGRAAGTTAN